MHRFIVLTNNPRIKVFPLYMWDHWAQEYLGNFPQITKQQDQDLNNHAPNHSECRIQDDGTVMPGTEWSTYRIYVSPVQISIVLNRLFMKCL